MGKWYAKFRTVVNFVPESRLPFVQISSIYRKTAAKAWNRYQRRLWRNGTLISVWNIPPRKTGLPFQMFRCSRKFSAGTTQKMKISPVHSSTPLFSRKCASILAQCCAILEQWDDCDTQNNIEESKRKRHTSVSFLTRTVAYQYKPSIRLAETAVFAS